MKTAHRDRRHLLSLCAAGLLAGCGEAPPLDGAAAPTAARRQASGVAREVTATLRVKDYRRWCDPAANYSGNTDAALRTTCTRLDYAPLAGAVVKIYGYDGTTSYPYLGSMTADEDGVVQFSDPALLQGYWFHIDWSGTRYGDSARSFRVFYSPGATSPSDLKSSAYRVARNKSTTIHTCAAGSAPCSVQHDFSFGSGNWSNDTADQQIDQEVAGAFLDLSYAYNQADLYEAEYFDYCRLHGCPNDSGAPLGYAVVGVGTADLAGGAGQTGNRTGYILMKHGYATGSTGPMLHELGHALQAWALGIDNERTSGTQTPSEEWADFAGMALMFRRNATAFTAFGYAGTTDIEAGALTCQDGTPYDPSKSIESCSPHLRADSTGYNVNLTRALWDLYDHQQAQEGQIFDCETAASKPNPFVNKGDHMTLGMPTLLHGWRRFSNTSTWPDQTGNHALREDEGGTLGESTRNLWDYAHNLRQQLIAQGGGASFGQIAGTLLYHNCLQLADEN